MTDSVTLQLEFAGLSDVGRSRSRNEDSFDLSPDAGLALVCDGMGGHAGGDIASKTAVETIVDFIYEYEPEEDGDDPDEVDELDELDDATVTDGSPSARNPDQGSASAIGRSIATIRAAVQLANRRLVTLNQQRGFPDGRGMGTTVVGLWLVANTDKVIIFHAGDSRLYRLRGDDLRQITRDHSLYQAWLDNGARGQPPHRNIIVRALGTTQEVEPEVGLQTVAENDLFLICSDGLSGMISDDEIAALLREKNETLSAACKRLVDLANEKGGHDNVTVVLARCVAKKNEDETLRLATA